MKTVSKLERRAKIKGRAKIQKLCQLFSTRGTGKKSEINRILSVLTTAQLHQVCELLFNIVYNPEFCNFTTAQKLKLCNAMKPHREDIKLLSDKYEGLKKKNAIQSQTGTGLISTIIAIAIPALIALISK